MSVDLMTLVRQLESEQMRKKDVIVPAELLSYSDGKLRINTEVGIDGLHDMLSKAGIIAPPPSGNEAFSFGTFEPTETFDAQIADKLKIPLSYLRRMRNEGQLPLLDENVNTWMDGLSQNFLVRLFSRTDDDNIGVARALLSDRYFMMDNLDVITTALEAIKQSGQKVVVESCDLTEKRMYVRFNAPDVEAEAPDLLRRYRVPGTHRSPDKPYSIVSGFVLSNSETGQGTFTVAPRLTVLACTNGMVIKSEQMRRVHLGARQDIGSITWSEETVRREFELIRSQVIDAVNAYLDPAWFGKVIADMTEQGVEPLKHPVDAIQNTAKFLNLTEEHRASLVDFFVQAGDTSRFGLPQAVTYLAHQVPSADLRYDLEGAAFDVLTKAREFDTN